jgi:hypothetical protein
MTAIKRGKIRGKGEREEKDKSTRERLRFVRFQYISKGSSKEVRLIPREEIISTIFFEHS